LFVDIIDRVKSNVGVL